MKLGIVGHGFVGTAVDHGFTRDIQKFIVDPKHNSTNTIEDLIKFKPDATFVAVPTPQLESGECNTEILEGVMQKLNTSKGLLVIVKSTVPAYKLQKIQEECINIRIVYNPEFLTEKITSMISSILPCTCLVVSTQILTQLKNYTRNIVIVLIVLCTRQI